MKNFKIRRTFKFWVDYEVTETETKDMTVKAENYEEAVYAAFFNELLNDENENLWITLERKESPFTLEADMGDEEILTYTASPENVKKAPLKKIIPQAYKLARDKGLRKDNERIIYAIQDYWEEKNPTYVTFEEWKRVCGEYFIVKRVEFDGISIEPNPAIDPKIVEKKRQELKKAGYYICETWEGVSLH